MKRTSLNVIVDLAAAMLLLGMIATGFILRFPLPPGTNKSHSLWGVTRHGWGTVHYWISAALLIVLLAHVVLHWHWLVSVLAKRLGWKLSDKRASQTGLWTLVLFAGASVLFAWISYSGVRPLSGPELVIPTPAATNEQSGSPKSRAAETDVEVSQRTLSREVETILQRSCSDCHGPERAAGAFRVDRKEDLFSNTNGGPLVVAGDSSRSPLMAIVSGQRIDLPHPDRHRLSEANVAVLRRWIDAGAHWPSDESR